MGIIPRRRKEKVKYISSSVLLFNLIPVVAALDLGTFLHTSLLYIYSWPLVLAEDLFDYRGSLFLLVTIPFWSVVGWITGYLLFFYSARSKSCNTIPRNLLVNAKRDVPNDSDLC